MSAAELKEILGALHKLGDVEALEVEIAKRAAPKLEAAVKKQVAEGKAPNGQAWAPKRVGSGKPYANAAAKISSKNVGPTVVVSLTGVEVYGHFGQKGKVPRPMLPDAGAAVPEIINEALTDTAGEVFAKLTGAK